MWNIFKRNSNNQKRQKEQKIKKPNYKLDGLYLKDEIDFDPVYEKIDENKKNIEANKIFIESNKNLINTNKNAIEVLATGLNNTSNKITENKNNINTNLNNINNLNNRVDRITNDLANSNIANYKGIYNANATYNLGDLVSSANNNNVYLSIKNNNVNNDLNNVNFWRIITFTIDTSMFVDENKVNQLLNNKIDPINNKVSNNETAINKNKNDITSLKNKLDNFDFGFKTYRETFNGSRLLQMFKSNLWSGNEYLYNCKMEIVNREPGTWINTLYVKKIGSGDGQTTQDRTLTVTSIITADGGHPEQYIAFDYFSAVDFFNGGVGNFTGTIWGVLVSRKLA